MRDTSDGETLRNFKSDSVPFWSLFKSTTLVGISIPEDTLFQVELENGKMRDQMVIISGAQYSSWIQVEVTWFLTFHGHQKWRFPWSNDLIFVVSASLISVIIRVRWSDPTQTAMLMGGRRETYISCCLIHILRDLDVWKSNQKGCWITAVTLE